MCVYVIGMLKIHSLSKCLVHQTELTSETVTDSQIEGRITAMGGGVGGGGIKQKGEWTHGQQCSDYGG